MLLGQILIKEGFCTDKDILAALDKQQHGDSRFIGEILISDNVITENQLKRALEIQFGTYKKGLLSPKWARVWCSLKKALFQ